MAERFCCTAHFRLYAHQHGLIAIRKYQAEGETTYARRRALGLCGRYGCDNPATAGVRCEKHQAESRAYYWAHKTAKSVAHAS